MDRSECETLQVVKVELGEVTDFVARGDLGQVTDCAWVKAAGDTETSALRDMTIKKR